MKKILNSKVAKIIAIAGLIYLLYVIVLILTGQKNVNNIKFWEKIVLIISIFLPGLGNLYCHNDKLSSLILGVLGVISSILLGLYWFL